MKSTTFQIVISYFIIAYIHESGSARNDVVSDIQWVYYNGKTTKEYKKYPLVNLYKVLNIKKFKARNKTVIYIHGYEESMTSNGSKKIVKAYLDGRKDTNVIVLDWSNLSNRGYLNNAAYNTEMVGRAAGTYLLNALGAGIQRSFLHIVGHSLGCHVAASIARKTQIHGVTLARITGLDCAMPGFFPAIIGMRLSTESASFVDVIHTDSGRYGIPTKIAHVDFWPNGGYRPQPGCDAVSVFQTINLSTLRNEFCSHEASWLYYAESVLSPKNFIAVKCTDYDTFKKSFCGDKETGLMGYGATSKLHGNYYLATATKSPFGQGMKGIKGTR